MSLLFESIKVLNGKPINLDAHFARIIHSRKALGIDSSVQDFENFFKNIQLPHFGLYKLRIDYDVKITEHKITSYSLPTFKYLKLFYSNSFDYSLKYSNRSFFNIIEKSIPPDFAAAIIISNRFTDATFANLLFFDGSDFYTPKTPLLNGTKRSLYIAENRIKTADLRISDIHSFQSIHLINSMIDIENHIFFQIDNIIF